MPGRNVEQAPKDTGPPSLANTLWALYRASSDSFIARVEFGSYGEVKRFYDNTAYFPEILGTELIPDGQVRPNVSPGMSYAAASYGLDNELGFGFAAYLRLWLGGIDAGRGIAYAYGVRDGDRLDGTFGYTTDVPLVEGSPFASGLSDEYQFYGLRE